MTSRSTAMLSMILQDWENNGRDIKQMKFSGRRRLFCVPRALEEEVKSDASSFIGAYRLAALMAGLAILRDSVSWPPDGRL